MGEVVSDYPVSIVIVIDSKGQDAISFLQKLYAIAAEVYSNAYFEVKNQPTTKEYCQVTFIPVRTTKGVPDLDSINMFALLLKNRLPEYNSIIFHNEKGHNWGDWRAHDTL
jgi:hypothetical protein